MTYEPEVGQAVFGAKWEEHNADWATAGLSLITEALAAAYPDNADPGYGFYGDGFRNEVFALRAYWWGDCTCGFDTLDWQWSEEHDHKPDCCHVRYEQASRDLKADIGGPNWKARHDRLTAWAKENGYPEAPTGMAVYCDCGHDGEYAAWREAGNDHAEDCREVLPNFEHFASGLAVHWYKYVGRGMSANRHAPDDWHAIVAACVASVARIEAEEAR